MDDCGLNLMYAVYTFQLLVHKVPLTQDIRDSNHGNTFSRTPPFSMFIVNTMRACDMCRICLSFSSLFPGCAQYWNLQGDRTDSDCVTWCSGFRVGVGKVVRAPLPGKPRPTW
jgi:hypothetical protein